ncbi:MAG TPA: Cof-type HAD-IIB family hydrolase [Actinomycetes bacterium]|nr:Cof-type HAD-IIB family hydrolase [Actinomycetes bacterium]
MNRSPRLIATDLDGTIIHDDGSVSPRTMVALRRAMDAGIRVVFVTGRPPRWMGAVADETGHAGIGICANGAYVYDMTTEQVLETYAMSAATAAEAVRRVREVLPQAAFGMESLAGFAHDENYHPRWDPDPLLGIGAIEDFLTDEIAKVLVRADGTPGDDMLRAVTPALDSVVEVTHSNVNDSLLELSAPGVNKATTLAILAERWGIDRADVVAFGDMPNDVELLRWAGLGYAVGDAHPLALEAADEHAPSIADDGVAQVIERLLDAS